MGTYRKEKNLIYLSVEEGKIYTIDINTGIIYGLKKQPIKSLPSVKKMNDLVYEQYTVSKQNICLASVLLSAFRDACNRQKYLSLLNVADRLDSLGLKLYTYRYDFVRMVEENFSLLGKYIKEKGTDIIDWGFERWANAEKAKAKFARYITPTTTPEMLVWIENHLPNATDEEISTILYYLDRQKMWAYNDYHFCLGTLEKYINRCRVMQIPLRKENNFMRVFIETEELYKNRKAEFDNKAIQLNYEKHANSWQFEYGNFTIVIPTCGQDLVTEGDKMHHCVGSYVGNIVRNDCYIIFVRKKDDIDGCYITCQVYTDGTIGQYYLSHDRKISSREDFEFKEMLQRHLLETW